MVAYKAHEVDRRISEPDGKFRAILLYGPDSGLVSERADLFAAKTGVNSADPFSTIRLDAETVADDRARLADEAFTVGMFGGDRLIRISGSTRKNLAEAVKPVLGQALTDTWIIIEAGDLAPKAALRSMFEKSARAWALPCYQDEGKVLDQLIREEISQEGLSISADTITLLKSFLGGDRRATRNELRKLALYAHGEKEVTRDHVAAIVGDASVFDVNDVIDAVTSGNMSALEKNLERVLQEGGSPDMVLLLAMRHFQLLHELRGKMEHGGMTAKSAVDGARPPFHYKRRTAITNAISRLSLETIEKVLDRLNRASFDARANPEIGTAIAGTSLMACVMETRRG